MDPYCAEDDEATSVIAEECNFRPDLHYCKGQEVPTTRALLAKGGSTAMTGFASDGVLVVFAESLQVAEGARSVYRTPSVCKTVAQNILKEPKSS